MLLRLSRAEFRNTLSVSVAVCSYWVLWLVSSCHFGRESRVARMCERQLSLLLSKLRLMQLFKVSELLFCYRERMELYKSVIMVTPICSIARSFSIFFFIRQFVKCPYRAIVALFSLICDASITYYWLSCCSPVFDIYIYYIYIHTHTYICTDITLSVLLSSVEFLFGIPIHVLGQKCFTV